MNRILTIALGLLLALPVAAVEFPRASGGDSRIKVVDYDENEVVPLYTTGKAVQVVFAPGEEVLDMAGEFSEGWSIMKRRNIVYFKPVTLEGKDGDLPLDPVPGKWDTNLLVATTLRNYAFDVHLVPKSDAGERLSYRVTFRYPADEAAKALAESERARAKAKLDTPNAVRNWQYTMQIGKRSKAIAPTMAYDDGRFTYLKFPNNREFPTVFLVDANKEESLVNTHVEKDVLIVHRVAPRLSLRLGEQVVGVFNEAYDMDGVPATTGTTVPGVERVIVSDGEGDVK